MPSSTRGPRATLAGHGPGPISPGGVCTGVCNGLSARIVGPTAAQVIGAFPPSTITVTPVTYLASSDSRKRTTGPTSSTGSPR